MEMSARLAGFLAFIIVTASTVAFIFAGSVYSQGQVASLVAEKKLQETYQAGVKTGIDRVNTELLEAVRKGGMNFQVADGSAQCQCKFTPAAPEVDAGPKGAK